MSVTTRLLTQESEIVQDSMTIDNTLDGPGDPLSVTLGGSTKTMAKIYRWIIGFSKVIGENGRRKGATRFNGSDLPLSGSITTVGTAVTGFSTFFLSELSAGDWIRGTTAEYREVQSIATDTSLTLVEAYTSDIVVAQALSRLQFFAERLDNLSAVSGLIFGNIFFNSTTVPPKVKAGAYEVAGAVKKITADLTLTLAGNALKKSLQALDTYSWYNIVLDGAGSAKYVLATGNQISSATGNISSIANPSGNTKRLNISTGTITGVAVGHILIIKGTLNNDGVYKITATDASTYMEVLTNDVLTGGAVGTYEVRTRITTSHLTGTATNINTNSEIEKYTPANVINPALNGYYLDDAGINTNVATKHRIIGVFFSNSVPNILSTHLYSYKSGNNKNDNEWWAYNIASFVTNAPRFSTYKKLHGNDYLLTDDGTYGSLVTYKSYAKAAAIWHFYYNGGGSTSLWLTNALVNDSSVAPNGFDLFQKVDTNAIAGVSFQGGVTPEETIKPLTSGSDTGSDYSVFRGSLIL